MIRCHFARLMGERKLKISDVHRDTAINRGTLTRLYYEDAERVEIEVLDKLCTYFSCAIGDLLEHVGEEAVQSALTTERMRPGSETAAAPTRSVRVVKGKAPKTR